MLIIKTKLANYLLNCHQLKILSLLIRGYGQETQLLLPFSVPSFFTQLWNGCEHANTDPLRKIGLLKDL